MGKNCVVCGKPSGMYPLCKEHLQMKAEGRIVKCDKCGTWHYAEQPCSGCEINTRIPPDFRPKKPKATFVIEDLVDIDGNETENDKSSSSIKCLICGEDSDGKHFCKSCYYKYKDKVLYLQVKKCTEFTKLDAEYQSDFTCDDGHLVKSPYEKIIDDWLFKEGINHAYETTLNVDKDHDIHPDFYIPEYNGIKDIYIEFWGYDEDNIKYTETKNYKKSIYPKICEEENITVLYLTKPDLNNASATLKKKLKYLEQGKVNE